MKHTAILTPHFLRTLTPRDSEYSVHDAQCAGLALRVQPGGTKSWVLSKRADGKSRRITLGTWPDMSPELARSAFHAAQAETTPLLDTRMAANLSFAILAQTYFAERKKTLKPSSIVPIQSYINAQLIPAFGSTLVGKITSAQVAEWFHAYSRSFPGGANVALGHFTTILNWGKAHGHLPQDLPNPAAPIRKNRRKARGRMMSSSQIRDLAHVLDLAEGKYWLPAKAIRLLLLTGCRRGEILSLRWSDVKRKRLCLRDAKTGPRDVLLSEPARETLVELRRATGNNTFVFPSIHSRSGHLEAIPQSWATFRRDAGLPDDIRIHDLRHTFASHAILAGESLPTTGKLLGHKSLRSTERYTHLDGSTLAKAAEKVARQIHTLMGS